MTGLGFTDGRTLLQSGNAVFTTRSTKPETLARRIAGAIDEQLGLDVGCLVRNGDELQAVIEDNPLGDVATNGSEFMALFLSKEPDPKLLKAHDPRSLAPEEVRLGDRVIYQWCPNGVLAAPAVGGFAEKYLDVTVTGATGTRRPSSPPCSRLRHPKPLSRQAASVFDSPGDPFVIEGLVHKTAVQDADKPVGQGTECLVMSILRWRS